MNDVKIYDFVREFRKSLLFGFALVAMVMMLHYVSAGASYAQTRASHFKLANGLEVVVIPDRRAPVVTHMVWYRAGRADEPQGSSGVAHFLEHLMFKGTEKIGPSDFSKIIARHGGQDNAFTTQDATAYFQRVAKDRLAIVMELEADRMANLRIDEKIFENERKVVLEERRSRVDNEPSGILQEQMHAALYLAHPYGVPIIGWEHEIRTLSPDDAMAFYKRFYAPNNAVLVISGDVTPEEVLKLAENTYGKLTPMAGLGPRKRVEEPEPKAARRVVLKDARAGKATIQRMYLVPNRTSAAPREAEALELLAHITGSSATGRLYNKLVVEQKIAASAGGWYGGTALDSGRLGFYAIAARDNSLDQIEAAIDEALLDIKANGVTAKELERARNTAIADLIYDTDSQSGLARTYGWTLATGGTIEDVEKQAERLAAVTLDDIAAVARKYLDIKRSVTGLLIPLPAPPDAKKPVTPPKPSDVLH